MGPKKKIYSQAELDAAISAISSEKLELKRKLTSEIDDKDIEIQQLKENLLYQHAWSGRSMKEAIWISVVALLERADPKNKEFREIDLTECNTCLQCASQRYSPVGLIWLNNSGIFFIIFISQYKYLIATFNICH